MTAEAATKPRVQELLKALGDTPADIAAALKARGIQGYECNPAACPIANYLHGAGMPFPNVNGPRITFKDDGRWVAHKTPDPIRQFINLFDNGEFPDLVKPDAEEDEG